MVMLVVLLYLVDGLHQSGSGEAFIDFYCNGLKMYGCVTEVTCASVS